MKAITFVYPKILQRSCHVVGQDVQELMRFGSRGQVPGEEVVEPIHAFTSEWGVPPSAGVIEMRRSDVISASHGNVMARREQRNVQLDNIVRRRWPAVRVGGASTERIGCD